MRHDVKFLARRRHDTRIPNNRLRQRGLHHLQLSPQGLYQLLRHCGNSQTRINEDVFPSSRGRTGNRKTPRGMLRQRLLMRLCVHRIIARIARPTRLEDQNTRVRNGAEIFKPMMQRGCRQFHRN